MTRAGVVACAVVSALGTTLFSPLPAAAADGTPYRWNQYQIELPKTGWKVSGDALDDQGNKRLTLQGGGDYLAVMITLFATANAPTPDRQSLEMPAGAAAALGMPLALKLAGPDGENAVALSYGSVDLSGGPAPLVHFTIGTGKEFLTLDSVLHLADKGGSAYAALVLSKGARGQIDTSGDHMRLAAEAYGIVRSIRVAAK